MADEFPLRRFGTPDGRTWADTTITTVAITDTRNDETSTYSWDVEHPAVAVVATIAALKGAARPVQVAQEVLAPYRNSGVTQEDLDTIRAELDAAIAAQGPD